MRTIDKNESSSSVCENIKNASLSFVSGAIGGYVYATLANLPSSKVAKAWAIWALANTALNTLITHFVTDNHSRKHYTSIASVLTTSVGIFLLQKRGLIETKMIFFLAGCTIYYLFNLNNKGDEKNGVFIIRR